MASKKIDIFVPIMPTDIFIDYFGIDQTEIIEEIESLSNNVNVQFNSEIIAPLEIKFMDKEDNEIKKYFKKDKHKIIDFYLKFSSEINIKDNEISILNNFYYSFSHYVESFVRHLLIYINIAKPGLIDTREGIILSYDFTNVLKMKREKFDMIANSIEYGLIIAKTYNWPELKSLPLKETIIWLQQNHWVAFEKISENKLQRALNAFSYLFHNNLSWDSSSDLFYSLIGIEAIYVEGNSDLQKQVDIKSQLLLGERNSFKKIFKELYDYRSRYIHGELNFPNKYLVDDLDRNTEDQIMNTYKKTNFATAFLIASIQAHFIKNANEFKYKLNLIE